MDQQKSTMDDRNQRLRPRENPSDTPLDHSSHVSTTALTLGQEASRFDPDADQQAQEESESEDLSSIKGSQQTPSDQGGFFADDLTRLMRQFRFSSEEDPCSFASGLDNPLLRRLSNVDEVPVVPLPALQRKRGRP